MIGEELRQTNRKETLGKMYQQSCISRGENENVQQNRSTTQKAAKKYELGISHHLPNRLSGDADHHGGIEVIGRRVVAGHGALTPLHLCVLTHVPHCDCI